MCVCGGWRQRWGVSSDGGRVAKARRGGFKSANGGWWTMEVLRAMEAEGGWG